jgi:tetratricopeptide (TPR) repeat protein
MKIRLLLLSPIILICICFQTDKLKEANKLADQNKNKEAIAICTAEINSLSPKDTLFIKFLELRASCYIVLPDYDSGIKDYKALIGYNPNKTDYYLGLSYLYGQKNNVNDALAILNKSLSISKTDGIIYSNLSYYSANAGKYDDAVKYATEGLKYTSAAQWKGVLLNNRGYGYIGLKQYDKALNDINESIKTYNDNPFAYCYRALANIGLKKMETVCDDLHKSKSIGGVQLTADLIKKYCNN